MRYGGGIEGLNRDPINGIWLGVCAGLGNAFGITHFKVRLVFVILTLLASPVVTFLLYGLLYFMMPKRGEWVDDFGGEDSYKDKIVVFGSLSVFLLVSFIVLSSNFS